MTRISKFLFALLIGFTVTTATGCDDPETENPDLSTKDGSVADLTPNKD